MVADDTLERLLEDTRLALLSGDLAALEGLAQACEAQLSQGITTDAARLHRIREQAARNAALLTAASRGVSAARRRLRELSGADGFSTYDSAGRRGPMAMVTDVPARRL